MKPWPTFCGNKHAGDFLGEGDGRGAKGHFILPEKLLLINNKAGLNSKFLSLAPLHAESNNLPLSE